MDQCINPARIVILRNPDKSVIIHDSDYATGSIVVIPENNLPLAAHITCGTEMHPSKNWYFCSHECLTKHVW